MPRTIRRIYYFYMKVVDRPGEAYKRLTKLKEMGVDMVAFALFPFGPMRTQVTLFPVDGARMAHEAKRIGFELEGPHPALLVQGDDELGALEEIHEKLFEANVNVEASSGVADGQGHFGYVIYVKSKDFERALAALEVS